MARITGSVVKYPARVSLGWFLAMMSLGGLILTHPVCRQPDAEAISAVDALFMATSAVCVTGLAVRSLENDLSLVGQMVIAVLVQLGGIGIMTITTFVLFRRGTPPEPSAAGHDQRDCRDRRGTGPAADIGQRSSDDD
jgi:trk system potassium uptake protein TrkH